MPYSQHFTFHWKLLVNIAVLFYIISPPGECNWKIALKYKVKQSKNGNFTSSCKASPIDFETQISFRR